MKTGCSLTLPPPPLESGISKIKNEKRESQQTPQGVGGDNTFDATITLFNAISEPEGVNKRIRSLAELGDLMTSEVLSANEFIGSYRKSDQFIQTMFLVGDDDSGTPIESAIERFKETACVILTTRHHRKEKLTSSGLSKPPCDRYRVVFLLESPIRDKDELEHNYRLLLSENPSFDKSIKDAGRAFFPASEIVFLNENGKKREVSIAPKASPPSAAVTSVPKSADDRGTLSKRTIDFLNHWKPELASVWPWHEEFIFAVKDLQGQNYTKEQARAVLSAITGHLDGNDMYQLNDVWNRTDFKIDFRPRRENLK